MKSLVHFAHGNGFPSLCYKQMLDHLKERFDYCYIDRVGHTSKYPVTENWQYLVQEVLDSIKSQSSEPVIAIGHSLGGVLSFRAAIEDPSVFKALILLDSPIIGPFKSKILRISKALGMIDHITPAFRTKGRRQSWPSREHAIEYLKDRELFMHFTPACLEDYIDYGLQKNENGYSLRFNRQIEYQIYRTIPHILHRYAGKLKVPAAIIYGSKSNVIDQTDLYYMEKHYDMQSYGIKGTHMFPMEHPKISAQLIIKAVDNLIPKGDSYVI